MESPKSQKTSGASSSQPYPKNQKAASAATPLVVGRTGWLGWLRSPVLQGIAAVVAVIATGVQYVSNLRPESALVVQLVSNAPLLSPNAKAIGTIKISVGQEQINIPSRAVLELKLAGHNPIRSADIEKPIILDFANASIISASIIEQNPKDVEVSCSVFEKNAKIMFGLLNPGDSFSVEIIYDGEIDTPKIEGRIARISSLAVIDSTRTDREMPIFLFGFPRYIELAMVVIGLLVSFFIAFGIFQAMKKAMIKKEVDAGVLAIDIVNDADVMKMLPLPPMLRLEEQVVWMRMLSGHRMPAFDDDQALLADFARAAGGISDLDPKDRASRLSGAATWIRKEIITAVLARIAEMPATKDDKLLIQQIENLASRQQAGEFGILQFMSLSWDLARESIARRAPKRPRASEVLGGILGVSIGAVIVAPIVLLSIKAAWDYFHLSRQ